MAAIAASNVSYSITKIDKDDFSNKVVRGTITFGNGALTYPANGIPLTDAKLGCPAVIDSLVIEGARASLYVYQWDPVHDSIRIFQVGASTTGPLVELTGAATPAATTLDVLVSGH